MTLSEFKAWFEGYTEGLEAAPTKAQFDRIKKKVKEIKGEVPTSYPIFVDRWIEPYRRWSAGTIGGDAQWGGVSYATNATLSAKGDSITTEWNPQTAFYELGKAEAQLAAA